jgi:sortase A
MSAASDRTNDPERLGSLGSAQSFNASLGGNGARPDNEGMGGSNDGRDDIPDAHADAGELPYREQLRWDGSPALCWVEIPAIDIELPVYHGTGDDVLAMGAGHVEGTSLPVGGSSSHCVIAAHSGMEQARMFDDVERLDESDVFVLHTLGDAYAYQIDRREVVDPDEVYDHCRIVPEQDRCTLLTCTPYGINSHRLLLGAHRVPYSAELEETPTSMSRLVPSRRTAPVLALGGGTSLVALSSIVARHRRRRRWKL